MKELEVQDITDYILWPGVFVPSIKKSINLAHKQIVEFAFESDLPEVCIAEEDIKFFGEGAWQFYLDNKPEDFDIYLSMIFLGSINERNIVTDFTGLTLYTVHQRFYTKFLTTPDDDHLDRLLKGLGNFVVCPKFICTQHNGVSGNTGKMEEYDNLLKGRPIFGK